MTYEEAREYFKKLKGCSANSREDCIGKESCEHCEYDYDTDKWENAISTAIEALEKQSELAHLRVCENWYYCMYEREVQDDKRRSNK